MRNDDTTAGRHKEERLQLAAAVLDLTAAESFVAADDTIGRTRDIWWYRNETVINETACVDVVVVVVLAVV